MDDRRSILCVIADFEFVGNEAEWLAKLRQVAEVATSHVHLQIRIRNIEGERFEELARRARDAVRDDVLLILNGNPELAESLGYLGTHYREADLCSGMPLSNLPIRTAAVHSMTIIDKIEGLEFSYLLYSPVFQPTWKDASPTGLGDLTNVCSRSAVPVVAFGGINNSNATSCLESGARGVAVISSVMGTGEPAKAVDGYVQRLQSFDAHRS